VADDHGLRTRVLQHRGAQRAREGAARALVAVLPAGDDPGVAQPLGHRRQHRGRREHAERAPAQARLDGPAGELAGQRQGVGAQAIHLPVAEDDRSREWHRRSVRETAGV
jgi:hypothetical protein